MSDFSRLYRYELKKLLTKKINAITLAICLSICFFTAVIGTFNADKIDMGYGRALDGQAIDTQLLNEMIDGYRKIPAGLDKYILSEEYQTYARPYSPIFNYVLGHSNMSKSDILNWDGDESELYRQSEEKRRYRYDEYKLKPGEIEYWEKQVAEKGEPVVFRYADGWNDILTEHVSIAFILMFGVTICLAGIFSDENNRRTDALILSSRHGRTKIYWAKVWAGISLTVLCVVITSALTMPISLIAFGIDGFSADIDLIYPYPGNLTVGKMLIIAEFCILAATVFCGVFAMLLSLCLHNSTASLGSSAAILTLGAMLYMAPKNRILGQISGVLPGAFISQWKFMDIRLVELFGHYFTSYEYVPVLYLIFDILIIVAGKFIYEKMQIKSR